ncbi:hypothetical protein, partial [Prevotella sp.]|uniref:hypothetical protein n=1 Tax=Prevotella sp. TaxID=59823 RepID=UPI003079B3BE
DGYMIKKCTALLGSAFFLYAWHDILSAMKKFKGVRAIIRYIFAVPTLFSRSFSLVSPFIL